jgi:hypothetical protein
VRTHCHAEAGEVEVEVGVGKEERGPWGRVGREREEARAWAGAGCSERTPKGMPGRAAAAERETMASAFAPAYDEDEAEDGVFVRDEAYLDAEGVEREGW